MLKTYYLFTINSEGAHVKHVYMYFFCFSLLLTLSLSLSDIDKIHDGIGDKLTILVQWVTTFFAGFIIGFIRGWQLALLLIAVTPFMVAGAAVFSKVREEGIEVDAHK